MRKHLDSPAMLQTQNQQHELEHNRNLSQKTLEGANSDDMSQKKQKTQTWHLEPAASELQTLINALSRSKCFTTRNIPTFTERRDSKSTECRILGLRSFVAT